MCKIFCPFCLGVIKTLDKVCECGAYYIGTLTYTDKDTEILTKLKDMAGSHADARVSKNFCFVQAGQDDDVSEEDVWYRKVD